MRLLSDLVQGSDEWHAWRRSGVGSSDSAAVLGVSPYRTPIQVWREKLGLYVDEDEGKEFVYQMGHAAERKMRATLEKRLGSPMPPACATHAKHSELIASLDGYDPKLGILEAKLVSQAVFHEIEKTQVLPAHHAIQTLHQLNVTGAPVVHYFAYNAALNEGVIIEVLPDASRMKELEERELFFWSLVTSKTPPELTDRDFFYLDDLDSDAKFHRMAEIKAAIDSLEKEFSEIKEKVVLSHTHPRLATQHGTLVRTVRQGNINYKAIPAIKNMSDLELNEFRGKEAIQYTFRRGK